MSRASFVPSTVDLDADDVATAVRSTTTRELLKDSFLRFRRSDGFSFARSLAFQVTFAILPTIIMVVGIAVRIGDRTFTTALREAITSIAPGAAGDFLLVAFEQGSDAGTGNLLAILIGGSAALVAAVTAMAQLQRGATRIYGLDKDRPTFKRYLVATLLTLTVGMMVATAFLAIVLGGVVDETFSNSASWWSWGRWVGGVVLVVVALGIIFKVAPNRQQPGIAWLAMGAGFAAIGWLVVTVGLSIYLNASASFGETYGPLAGFMGLMLWTQLSAIAILFGIAVAAQLEAVRAGVPSPVIESDPDRGAAWTT